MIESATYDRKLTLPGTIQNPDRKEIQTYFCPNLNFIYYLQQNQDRQILTSPILLPTLVRASGVKNGQGQIYGSVWLVQQALIVFAMQSGPGLCSLPNTPVGCVKHAVLKIEFGW